MPRLKYQLPRIARNRNTAVVHLDGQTIRLGRFGTSEAQEAYDRLIAEWLANSRKLPRQTIDEEPVTLTELCVAFTRYVEARHHPREVVNYKSMIRIVRKLYGSEPIESFGPRRLAVVRDQMVRGDAEADPPRRPWARSHVNKQVSRLRQMFRWGVSREMVDQYVYDRLLTLEPLRKGEAQREGRKVTTVTRQYVRMVRPHLSRQVRALIALQLLTGARADELVRLRATDIETSSSVWTVTYDGSDEHHRHKTAHHDKTRTLHFGRRAQRVLRLFMVPGRDVNRPLFSPKDAAAERYAACRWHGKRKPAKTDRTLRDAYCTTTYRQAIYHACRKAGIPKWTPHQLRHTAGTAIRDRFSLEHAQAVLGHSSYKMAEHYAKVSDKRAREVIERIG